MFLFKCEAFLVPMLFIGSSIANLTVSTASNGSNTGGSCDPMVDMLFVLDNSSSVSPQDLNMQKMFVADLVKDHRAPSGAVRLATMVCSTKTESSTAFTDKLPKHAGQVVIGSEKSSEMERHTCLDSINLKFQKESRSKVTRLTVILKSEWNWNANDSHKQYGNISVIIAVGINEYEGLSALQKLASNDRTFFVVSKYGDLKNLAAILAKGSCIPVSLDLTAEDQNIAQTTNLPQILNDSVPCIRLSERMFKKNVPGFGYIRQTCPDITVLDLNICACL